MSLVLIISAHNTDKEYPRIYKVLVFYWILIGLSQVALFIQDISVAMSSTVDKVKERSTLDSVMIISKLKEKRGNDQDIELEDVAKT